MATDLNKWNVDFNRIKSSTKYQEPLGFCEVSEVESQSVVSSNRRVELRKLRHKAALQLLTGQGGQLMMNLFMMWMAGSQLNLWNIFFLGAMCWNPVKSILNIQATFAKLDEDDEGHVLWMKIGYGLLNLTSMSLAFYKCATMGLLPTTPADWLEFLTPPQASELSAVAFAQSLTS